MTLLQYVALTYLESKGEEQIQTESLAGLLDVKDEILLNELNGLLYNPLFNKGKLVNSGIITGDCDNGKDIASENKVWINKKFNSQNLKLNSIPIVMKKAKVGGGDGDEDPGDIIRRQEGFVLDATITRIMKGRIGKTTTHLELVNETARQIELFKAQPDQIKFRIEALIDKGIMKRKEGQYDQYEYIS